MGVRRRLGRQKAHYDPNFTLTSLSVISGSLLSIDLIASLASQGLFPAWLLSVLLISGLFVRLYVDSKRFHLSQTFTGFTVTITIQIGVTLLQKLLSLIPRNNFLASIFPFELTTCCWGHVAEIIYLIFDPLLVQMSLFF